MINHYKSFFDDVAIPGFWSIKMKEKENIGKGIACQLASDPWSFSICCFG
jgi:hypothetical protein